LMQMCWKIQPEERPVSFLFSFLPLRSSFSNLMIKSFLTILCVCLFVCFVCLFVDTELQSDSRSFGQMNIQHYHYYSTKCIRCVFTPHIKTHFQDPFHICMQVIEYCLCLVFRFVFYF
jgi:hypothetical protein